MSILSDHADGLRPPGVMVSSTFYDLKQHREDLRRFIGDELGYRPLLSEHPSFPIDPDVPTVENCRQRVERDADVLVLVVGGRYGSIDDHSARSVTNLEYLAARQKGIPIYAFVDRKVLSLLSVWRDNPSADFSATVDTPHLFEFVKQLRDVDKVWVHEFGYAQEIIDVLRLQFAYAHRAGLLLRRRLRSDRDREWLDGLRGQTLKIALEEPAGWPWRLFANGLVDAIRAHHRAQRRNQLGIPFGLGEDVNQPFEWLKSRFQDAQRLPTALTELVDNQLPVALGSTGTPPDAERIVFLFESMGALYADALRWTERVRAANIHEAFRPVLAPLGLMLNDVISEFEQFSADLLGRVNSAVELILRGEDVVIEMTLKITVSDRVISEFNRQLGLAAARYAKD